jgi:hypothetical protein
MSSDKKLCNCVDCLNKSNGKGRYIHNKTWNRHKKNSNINQELEHDLNSDSEITSDSNTSSSMSLDENRTEINKLSGICY